jgi:hypothetical protein
VYKISGRQETGLRGRPKPNTGRPLEAVHTIVCHKRPTVVYADRKSYNSKKMETDERGILNNSTSGFVDHILRFVIHKRICGTQMIHKDKYQIKKNYENTNTHNQR